MGKKDKKLVNIVKKQAKPPNIFDQMNTIKESVDGIF
jgi:hypothetical protein